MTHTEPLGFGYIRTDKRYISRWKDGAWDNGVLSEDDTVALSECACVLQYAQTCFEGLKAYRTEDGRVVCFRPDLNAERLENSCRRMVMPVFPRERFMDALRQVVLANLDAVPPYGSGGSLYIRPYVFGVSPTLGIKPATEYEFRMFASPVGAYFHGGARPLHLRVCPYDRAAPRGTGHIKAGSTTP